MRNQIVALLAAIVAHSASADMIMKQDDAMIRLTDQPCIPKILAMIPDQYKSLFRGGGAIFQGRPLRLCWAVDGDTFLIIDEEGDGGRLPIGVFREYHGV